MSLFMKLNREYVKLMEGLNLLMSADRRTARINSIPITKNTGGEHWWAIVKLARELVDQGCNVVCEARFYGSKRRADLFVPELKMVVEVVDTEGLKSIGEKKRFYKGLGVRLGYVTVVELGFMTVSDAVTNIFKRSKE